MNPRAAGVRKLLLFGQEARANAEDQKRPHPNPPPQAGEGADECRGEGSRQTPRKQARITPTSEEGRKTNRTSALPGNAQTRRKINVPFVPPNPKEFDSTMSTLASRAVCAT